MTETDKTVEAISKIASVPTLLDVVCRTTGMGFAAIAQVTPDRWIACGVHDTIAFGLAPGGVLDVGSTICNEIREHRQVVVIDDVDADPAYAHHHTPAIYGLKSYISVPITLLDGSFFGTLCAIDRVPRLLNTPETLGMFRLFAELIAFHLDAQQRVSNSENALENERQGSELREQFIAVLGHDLKNPLASLDAGVRMLDRADIDQKSKTIVTLMQTSIARMSGLIDNVLDFARGRLGGGLAIAASGRIPVKPVLQHVIAELRVAHPSRAIEADLADVMLRCDEGRIGQLLSNLVANALTHGSADGPVRVSSRIAGDSFEIDVSNPGEKIPPVVTSEMFKPFFRAAVKPGQQGLGLGLYIASEIARAHRGDLSVSSSDEETCFTFRMPAT